MGEQTPRLLEFTKMSGAGNDFVVLDNRPGFIQDGAQFARAVCDRRFGVGADGVLLLETSRAADFMMRYYNADGSYGGMCGNGGRCISRFAYAQHIVNKRDMRFEALDYVYSAQLSDDTVKLWMKVPSDFRVNKDLEILGTKIRYHFVNTGSPHCVIFLDENTSLGSTVDDVRVDHFGKGIRHDKIFLPEGTNVSFVEQISPNAFYSRTYERGVEAETLACGTGSVAVALLTHRVKGAGAPVRIRVKSGEELVVGFSHVDDDEYQNVTLEGSARVTFKGVVNYDPRTRSISDVP